LQELATRIRLPVNLGVRESTDVTPHTVADPVQLRRDLEAVRTTGLAYNRQESRLGLVAIATRVRNHTGTTVAAVAVSAPAWRYGHNLGVLAGPLRRTAAEIERRLGCHPVVGDRTTGRANLERIPLV
jgi:DNA-binding IclR family transcriptional regulator